MWLEENRANILTDNPGLNESEVIKEGMSRFRILSTEERMVRNVLSFIFILDFFLPPPIFLIISS